MLNNTSISILIFSKDRAMQLDGCIRSLYLHCRDIDLVTCHVLYKTTNDRHERQYQALSKEYQKIVFLKEDIFIKNVNFILSDSDYILFLVDDNIFIRPWYFSEVIDALKNNKKAIGFSFRLGENTTHSYSLDQEQDLPNFSQYSSSIIKFKWIKEKENDFNYPFEVSSSLYRSSDILKAISNDHKIDNPNDFEAILDSKKIKFTESNPELLCYKKSVAFCNPANVTQLNYLNRYSSNSNNSIKSLSKKFDLGFRIDVEQFIDFTPISCHQELQFHFKRPEDSGGQISVQAVIDTNFKNKYEQGYKTDIACSIDLEQLDEKELEVALQFVAYIKEYEENSESLAWLLYVLKKFNSHQIPEIEKQRKLIEKFRSKLNDVTQYCIELENYKIHLNNTIKGLEISIEKFQNEVIDLKNKLRLHQKLLDETYQNYQKSLNQIYTSRTYRLATMFRRASSDKFFLFLFPLHLFIFLLPGKIKRFFSINRQRMKRVVAYTLNRLKNKKWPDNLPMVSVVIPCYNYGRYLLEAIDSILSQTWNDLEIVVVDDGSDDQETKNIIESIDDPRIQIVKQKNLKLPAARNRGILNSKGKYICCLDADDKLEPTYIEKCLFKIETGHLDVCGCWQKNFENENRILKPPVFALETLLKSNCMINAAVYRRTLWETVGGYDEKMTDGYEDWDFWIRVAGKGATAEIIPEPLFLYRKHGRSMIDHSIEKHDKIYQYIKRKNAHLYQKLHTRDASCINKSVNRKINLKNLIRHEMVNVEKIDVIIAMPFIEVGGAERITSHICKALTKRGFRFSVVTTEETSHPNIGAVEWFLPSTERIYNLPCFLTHDQWENFILYLIKSRNTDILWVIGSNYIYNLLPKIKTLFPNIKVVDLLFNEYGHTKNNFKYNYCIDLTVTENEKVEEYLLKNNYPIKSIKTISNGIDLKRFVPQEKKSCGIYGSEKKFVVGYFGRISEEKGPDLFLSIAEHFHQNENIFFIMAGDGPMKENINEHVKKAELNHLVHLVGIVDVERELPRCDVIVIPSRIDGRPNIAMESLSMGIPVIASNVGGLSRIVHDGKTGFLCEPENVGCFTEMITRLMENTAMLSQMKKQSRSDAEKKMDINRTFDAYDETFKGLVDRRI